MRATRLAGMALVASALVFAQQTIVKERVIVHSNAPGVPSPPSPPPAPQIEYFAAEFDGAVVKGVPYSAEAVTETTQSLADGNRISRKTTALLFRDSEGRTRREQTLGAIGPWASQSAESPRTVFIHDPVAGVNYVLNSSDHTAQRLPPASGLFELPLPPPPPSPPAPPSTTGNIMYRSSTITHANAGQTKDEQLGKQVIEGVEAEGTRSVVTIPAGQIGNERPIEIVSERWYSPKLQLVVMSKHNDPRLGETIYRLTSVNLGEPAPSLFQVPADFTAAEGPRNVLIKKLKVTK